MIRIELVCIHRIGSPFQAKAIPAERGESYMRRRELMGDAERWELLPVPACSCCGEAGWENRRCTKHQDRNPCVVEGCKRTRKSGGILSDDWSICGEHWKTYVPPRSPERRAVNRLFAIAKKLGFKRTARWPPELEARYYRLWSGIARRVKARSTEGHLDQAAIERMFGWDT